jgi:hypothetical protein
MSSFINVLLHLCSNIPQRHTDRPLELPIIVKLVVEQISVFHTIQTALLPGVCSVCRHHRQCKLHSVRICDVIYSTPYRDEFRKGCCNTGSKNIHSVFHVAGQSREEWTPLSVAMQQ